MSSNCKANHTYYLLLITCYLIANHTYYLLLITYYLKMKQENALHWKDYSLTSYSLASNFLKDNLLLLTF